MKARVTSILVLSAGLFSWSAVGVAQEYTFQGGYPTPDTGLTKW